MTPTFEKILKAIVDYKKVHGHEPTEMQLMRETGYSRDTIRRAMKYFVQDGIIKKVILPPRGAYELSKYELST